jgi:hypothetical protein
MPETRTAVQGGLFASGGQAAVPLTGVSIAADVRSLCARVTVTQRYVNREAVPIEAVYVFPLDEGAAVCGFEALIDGTLVVGEVKPRDEAFQLYDDAMAEGHGTYLLDEERPDVFQASVGNLPPGKEVFLKLTYVTELAVDRGNVRFVIPTTVSPRYAPAADRVGVGRPDAEALNPPRDFRVPYGLALSIRVRMPGRIGRVSSPSHPIDLRMDDEGLTVSLAQQQAALDRDFVLSLDETGLDVPRAWIERTEEGRYALAIGFVPAFEATAVPSEVIFVVDRSGSMQGSSIEEVRNALQLCLRSLIPGCRFNIVGFGNTFSALFDTSRPYDEASLREATEHVAHLEADLGGTEILPALAAVLQAPTVPELRRQVVVLTDGQVSNTDEVIALVKAHASTARVFSVGIGAGASRSLVQGVARAGGGTAEYIAPGERIEATVVRLVGRLLSPALTSVRLDWGGLAATPAPSVVPPVFAGARLLQYAFVDHVRPAVLRLTAEGASGPMAFEVPVDPAAAIPGSVVATLAARARIRELEESPAWVATRRSRQQRPRSNPAVAEIIDLATRYGLVSRETSYVAIERREQPVLGDVQLRKVPVPITSGWGGLDRLDTALTLAAAVALCATDEASPFGSPAMRQVASRSLPEAGWWRMEVRADRSGPPMPSTPASAEQPEDLFARIRQSLDLGAPADPVRSTMLRLTSLQRADGTWMLDRGLYAAIGVKPRDAARRLADLTAGIGDAERADAERAWATALALAWFETTATALGDEWRLLADKAERWLDAARIGALSASDWREAAREVVGGRWSSRPARA